MIRQERSGSQTEPIEAKVRVADYIFQRLANAGMKQVFIVTGGGAMHLNDAVGRCSSVAYVCCHHEQACAIAAEGYARVSGIPGIVQVTTGPGGINALNGVFGAWTDSIPMFVVSGQVKRETCMSFTNVPLRQLGDQEADIISMVKGITKYAAMIREPEDIRYHLEKAIYLINSGRPGPVWLDIPSDVQAAVVSPSEMRSFAPEKEDCLLPHLSEANELDKHVSKLLEMIKKAERPVFMVGNGVRLAGAYEIFQELVEKLGIPVVTAFNAHDLITSDHPYYAGRPGTIGDRAGNFVAQNSDLLLVVGSRLNIRQISYNWQAFARAAYKVQVDIDKSEMDKPTVNIDWKITADAKPFFQLMVDKLNEHPKEPHTTWIKWSKERLKRYPTMLQKHKEAPDGFINPYHFVHILQSNLEAHDVLVCGDATACIVPFQVVQIKKGQRLFSNSGDASMGYDLPAAVGAAIAHGGKRRIICSAGDGSIQMNIQELQTIVHHQLPIKIFVYNNDGYLSMKQTQDGYFKLRIGAEKNSGVSFPDMVKIAQAYGIPARRWHSAAQAEDEITEVLSSQGPELVDVSLDPAQVFEPKLASRRLADGRMYSAPLEDLAPFLSPEELRENMIIPCLEPEK